MTPSIPLLGGGVGELGEAMVRLALLTYPASVGLWNRRAGPPLLFYPDLPPGLPPWRPPWLVVVGLLQCRAYRSSSLHSGSCGGMLPDLAAGT